MMSIPMAISVMLSSILAVAAAPAAGPITTLQASLARAVDPTSDLNLGVFSLGFINATCTGTLISQQGHVLTARHCVDSSVIFGNKMINMVGYPVEGTLFTINEVHRDQIYLNANRVNAIANTLLIPLGLDTGTVQGRIVYSGMGKTYPLFENEFKNPTAELIQEHRDTLNMGYGEGGDFAIVQIPQLKDRACYRLSLQAVVKGDRVQSVGFPCTKKFGDWPQARTGTVNNLAKPSESVAQDSTDTIFLPTGTFTTDATAQECNSGTAGMNDEGEIVGVLDAIYPNKNKLRSSFYLSTARLLELLPSQIREEILELNSACQKKP